MKFYVLKVGFQNNEPLVKSYCLQDILKMKAADLENMIFTFSGSLAFKSLNNDLKDYVKA